MQNHTQTGPGEPGQGPPVLSPADIAKAIGAVNNDPKARGFLRSLFGGDFFCIKTENRASYFHVAKDGQIRIVQETPGSYYQLKTSEAFLSRAWQDYNDGRKLNYGKVEENVEIPFNVKAKLFWAGINRG